MNLGAILVSSFFIGLSGAMMPGGLLIVNINETIRRGLPGGLLVITGHALIELLAVTGLALGLGTILGQQAVVGTIAVAGGALLAWMAIGTAKTSRTAEIAMSTEASGNAAPSGLGPLAAGGLATISNPYWALWWTSVGATYVAIAMEHAIFFTRLCLVLPRLPSSCDGSEANQPKGLPKSLAHRQHLLSCSSHLLHLVRRRTALGLLAWGTGY